MPPWGIVRRIDASHSEPGTAYMAVDYHLVDNRDPFFFKTSNFGQTWTRIDGGLPKGHPLDYALSIAENPNRKGMIFAGTGHAFFYSLDDGKTWKQFKDRLPAAPVNWIEVPKNAAEVAVATYGRGLWILRNLWQLEQGDTEPQADLQLYKPRPATLRGNGGTASFVFGLKSMPSAPASPIVLEILGADGAVISKTDVQGRAGLNQVSWNLSHASPAQPVLRSIPPDNPHIWEAGRWQGRERPVTHWGIGSQFWQPRAAPGKYTVRLTHDGKQHSQPFEVWRDVSLPSTDADLVAASEMQRNVVATVNEVVDKINRIEIMRMKVEDLRKQHAANRALDQALAALYQRMYETELHFLSRTEMHSDDKWYVEKYKLYMNLVWLLAEIGGSGGDVAGGAAYRPTNAAVAVYKDRLAELEAARKDFDRLLKEVEAFNKTHAGAVAAITDRM
jgi:uncharacterized membrane-anchored protein YhcB (DUF1043 family)